MTAQLIKSNWWVPVMAVGLCSVVVVVVFDSMRANPYMEYLKRTGRGATSKMMEQQIGPVADVENAAPLFLKAISLLEAMHAADRIVLNKRLLGIIDKLSLSDTINQGVRETLAGHMAAYRKVLPLIHEGAKRPHFRMDASHDGRDSLQAMIALQRWENLYSLSTVLIYEGLDAIARQDLNCLESCLETALRLPVLFAQEPRGRSVDLAATQVGDAFFLLEHALSRTALSREALERLQRILEDPYYHSFSAMKAANAYALATGLERYHAGGFQLEGHHLDIMRATMTFLMSAGDLDNHIQPLYLILLADTICLQETVEEASRAYNDFFRNLDTRDVYGYPDYSMEMTGLMDEYEPWRFGYLASAAVVRAAVAVARYRVDHQRLPEALIDLAPDYLSDIPRDPFTKNDPLGYHQKEDRVVIESRGYDVMLLRPGNKGNKEMKRQVQIRFSILRSPQDL